MILLICSKLVLVAELVTTRQGSVLVLQVLLALPVKERNAKMIAVGEDNAYQ
jgi:hypothetical protein